MIADMKKAKINDKLYDVIDFNSYIENKDAYIPSYTAIKHSGYILPIINQYDTEPGIFIGSPMCYLNIPDDIDDQYKEENIIDFSNVENVKDLIEKQETVKKLEREILTSPDNIFTPRITDRDSPEMKGLKEAVIKKNIDIHKYEHRFGANANNDIRLFNKESISMSMTKRLCNALDIKATLILEDKSPDIPNPIGEKIIIDLVEGDSDGN